jgi:hypothetical protein
MIEPRLGRMQIYLLLTPAFLSLIRLKVQQKCKEKDLARILPQFYRSGAISFKIGMMSFSLSATSVDWVTYFPDVGLGREI